MQPRHSTILVELLAINKPLHINFGLFKVFLAALVSVAPNVFEDVALQEAFKSLLGRAWPVERQCIQCRRLFCSDWGGLLWSCCNLREVVVAGRGAGLPLVVAAQAVVVDCLLIKLVNNQLTQTHTGLKR